MDRQERYEMLGCLQSSTKADKYGVTFQPPSLKDDEVQYVIPEPLVDAISGSRRGWLSEQEIELEMFFAQLCRRVGIVGFGCGGGVRYPLLESLNRKTTGLHERFEAHQCVMQFANRVIDQFNVPQLAFLGWLTKHSPYQKDRLRLLRKWRKLGSNPTYLTGRNHLRQYRTMPAQMQYGSGLHPELCNDFLA
ncbi:MAG TPA: hypothetical protein PLX97_07975, partial [Gemmatales bacterium]|nr:hypothetical protein [Gemmatales bacterium]